MFCIELAKMEEGGCLRVVAADDGHNMCSKDTLRDDKFGHRNAVQQLVYGSCRIYGSRIYCCSILLTRKYDPRAGNWEEGHIYCVRILDVDWRSVEHARRLHLQLVYD